MRIHTNTITRRQIWESVPQSPFLSIDISEHGSRSHDHAFEVSLEWLGQKVKGDGRYRKNYGTSGGGFDQPYAATYDEWGLFLAALYELDPTMKATYYKDREDFYAKTQEVKDADWRKDAHFPWLNNKENR